MSMSVPAKNIPTFLAEDHCVAEYSEFLVDRLTPPRPLNFSPFHKKWNNITWREQGELALHMCVCRAG